MLENSQYLLVGYFYSWYTGQSMAQLSKKNSFSAGDDWSGHQPEGKLAVDVLETAKEIIVVAPIAGADYEAIEIFTHHDIITIRGQRQSPAIPSGSTHIHEECFWGPFSRTVVLPTEVKSEQARAEYKNGILTIIVPKRITNTKIPVKIIEE